MRRKPVAPYPRSFTDDPSTNEQVQPTSPLVFVEKERGSIPHSSCEGDEEYVEIIKSRPILDGQRSRGYQSHDGVPNFTKSFELSRFNTTKVVAHTVRSLRRPKFRRPPPPPAIQDDAKIPRVQNLNFELIFDLMHPLRFIDGFIERTGIPFLLRYRTPVKLIIILVVTWQICTIIDQLTNIIKFYCGL